METGWPPMLRYRESGEEGREWGIVGEEREGVGDSWGRKGESGG